jgi:hypothetical protein
MRSPPSTETTPPSTSRPIRRRPIRRRPIRQGQQRAGRQRAGQHRVSGTSRRKFRYARPARPVTKDGRRRLAQIMRRRGSLVNLGQMKLMDPEMWPGLPYPLGATYDGVGTNFALFSEAAERVELCLFDESGNEKRQDVTEVDGYVWHCFLPGTGPGQRYGYRVYGPHMPDAGLRCNETKLDRKSVV